MGPTSDQGKPPAPTSEMIAEAVARCRPELERLFRRDWVTREEADELLEEVLISLVMRWGRTGDPSLWLPGAVDRAIQRRLLIPAFR